jgi:hypothetical protein
VDQAAGLAGERHELVAMSATYRRGQFLSELFGLGRDLVLPGIPPSMNGICSARGDVS